MSKYGNPKPHHKRRSEEEYNDEMEDTIARIVKSKRELDASISEEEWLSYLGDIGSNVSDPNVWQYMLEVREKIEESVGVTVVEKENGQISFIEKATHKFISWKKAGGGRLQELIDSFRSSRRKKR